MSLTGNDGKALPEIPPITKSTPPEERTVIREAGKWSEKLVAATAALSALEAEMKSNGGGASDSGTSTPEEAAPSQVSQSDASPPPLEDVDPELAGLLAEAQGMLSGIQSAKALTALGEATLDPAAALTLLQAKGYTPGDPITTELVASLPPSLVKAKGVAGTGSSGSTTPVQVGLDRHRSIHDFEYFEKNRDAINAARKKGIL